MPELSTLHELVAQWRKRADEAGYFCEALAWHKEKKIEYETARQAYQNAADELERELRRMDEPDSE